MGGEKGRYFEGLHLHCGERLESAFERRVERPRRNNIGLLLAVLYVVVGNSRMVAVNRKCAECI